jgi:hypothetical protein
LSYYPVKIKVDAVKLRQKGFSLSEISQKLSISKSTASLWLKDISLSPLAINNLKRKKILGQYKTILLRKKKRKTLLSEIEKLSTKTIDKIYLNKNLAKTFCSLIYYCEGIKGSDTRVTFINSEPTLIKLFLKFFRTAFKTSENKFRVLMHLHNYHDEKTQKLFWSGITKIPISQFSKTFWKQNTAKRIKKSYPGCISIRYYDARIAKELLILYKVIVDKYCG